jgi:tRNA-dihydrouridine synthase B
VLAYTGADAVMIGRAAQGRPWIFREIAHFLATGETLPPPEAAEIREVLVGHLHDLYDFYGCERGVRVARKHIGWYTKGLPGSAELRNAVNQQDDPAVVVRMLQKFYSPWLARSAA